MTYKYRVVKVSIDGGLIKYVAQEKRKELIIEGFWFIKRKEKFIWKNLYTFKRGTDMLIPGYYDTEEEAWARIDSHKSALKVDEYKIEELEIMYE